MQCVDEQDEDADAVGSGDRGEDRLANEEPAEAGAWRRTLPGTSGCWTATADKV